MKVKVTRPERVLRVDISANDLRYMLAPHEDGNWVLIWFYNNNGTITLEWRED